ncbi:MAG TPA: extracellular solute-binding protein [Gammaproteobacteria bacterium]|nr:extracellular solute-binding protein [Gammaproteobacteria bacterium]
MDKTRLLPVPLSAAALGLGLALTASAAGASTLTVYAAGTLAVPFHRIDRAFEQAHPGVTVQGEFGGSVMMARRIANLHQHADVYAAAAYGVIPRVLGKAHLANWYIGFASNAATLAYTSHSKGADHIGPHDWYKVVSQPGVVIGRSNPDTDPSGYQFLQMLSLASRYYHDPGLKKQVLANAPKSAMRDTETSLISALQTGQIDYLAIYSSSAKSHHLRYVKLPNRINLSQPADAAYYKHGVAHTSKGVLHGAPLIYGVTIPENAPSTKLGQEYIKFLMGPKGRRIMAQSGFGTFGHPWAQGMNHMPASLRNSVRPWGSG